MIFLQLPLHSLDKLDYLGGFVATLECLINDVLKVKGFFTTVAIKQLATLPTERLQIEGV